MQLYHRASFKFCAKYLEHFPPRQAPAINDAVCRLEVDDVVSRMTAATQSDDIEPHDTPALPIDKHVGWNILHNTSVTTNHCQSPNTAKLMHGNGARYKRTILDNNVATQHGTIGTNAIIAHGDIVAEVRIGHGIVVVADGCGMVWLEGAVDRGILAENIMITNDNLPNALRSSDVLWGSTDNRILAKLIVATGLHTTLHHGTIGNGTEIAKFNISFHRCKSTNRDTDAQSCSWMDGGKWVDAHDSSFCTVESV